MKTKILSLFLFGILLSLWGCSNDGDLSKDNDTASSNTKENENTDISSLVDTKWKLAGIMNVETGELKTLEPYNIKTENDCEDCYTLTFDTDTTAWGRSCANIIQAFTKKTAAGFYMGICTYVYETGDCGLFLEVLPLVDDCFFEENLLIFAYTQDKVRYYLTYKRAES
jgi:hypothetical protein